MNEDKDCKIPHLIYVVIVFFMYGKKALFTSFSSSIIIMKTKNNIHAVNVSRPHIEQIVTQHTTMELSNNSIIS